MANFTPPSYAMAVPTATAAAYPSSTASFVLSADLVPAAALAISTRPVILEAMICQTTAAGGTVTISNAAVTAATTLVITTVNPVPGTTIRFGDGGISMGLGLKVVTGAAAGGWIFIYSFSG